MPGEGGEPPRGGKGNAAPPDGAGPADAGNAAPPGRGSGAESAPPGQARPVRRAVSFVVFRDEARDELLSVRRPPNDEDLPDVWGLPAGSLRSGEDWQEAVRRAGREKLGVELRVVEPLEEGAVERKGYVLRMRLFRAEIPDGEPEVPQPVPAVTQYTAWEWAPAARLEEAARRGSLCSRLCLRWLRRSGREPGAG